MQYEPTAAEIAWAAGLFEGEGTWGYQPNNVRAALAMSDHDVVRRFHEVVGVGYCALKKKYADHHKQQLYWQVSDCAGVAHVLGLFAPWLGPRRLERGREILRIQAEVIAANQARRAERCRNGHLRTPENTRMQSRTNGPPYRRCRDCNNEWAKAQRLAQTMGDE